MNLEKEHKRLWNEITTHTYDFGIKAKKIEMLETIEKQEFVEHFNSIFFSEKTKRLDLQLTSVAHKEEQESERKINESEDKVFKTMKRIFIQESIIDFKKESGMHPNDYIARYMMMHI